MFWTNELHTGSWISCSDPDCLLSVTYKLYRDCCLCYICNIRVTMKGASVFGSHGDIVSHMKFLRHYWRCFSQSIARWSVFLLDLYVSFGYLCIRDSRTFSLNITNHITTVCHYLDPPVLRQGVAAVRERPVATEVVQCFILQFICF